MTKEIFNSIESLNLVTNIIELANDVIEDIVLKENDINDEELKKAIATGIKYTKDKSKFIGAGIGGTVGGTGGLAFGIGLSTLLAAKGTVGAAAITSGLAGVGSIIGGGMIAGILTLMVIPAALAGAGAVAGMVIASSKNTDRREQKKILLENGKEKLSKLEDKLLNRCPKNKEFIMGMILLLQATLNDLRRDLEIS